MIAISYSVVMADEAPIDLESAHIDSSNVRSIERGAKIYARYCLTCHALQFLDHDPIARAAGITPDKMPDKNKNWWFGVSPPDLSLIARIHSVDWLYTYLHVFYKDIHRPTGMNNLLMENVNMPDPFVGFHGEQVLLVEKEDFFRRSQDLFSRKVPYFRVIGVKSAGSLRSDEFDSMVRDLVNFLDYASDPKKQFRKFIGIWVLCFIGIFSIIIFLLKREYWRHLNK